VLSLPLLDSAEPSDFVTVLLLVALEGLLSADNAMVLAVLVLGLPRHEQQKALRYGILGAFAFRSLATLLAVYLIGLAWVKLAGAAYLLYLSAHHFLQHGVLGLPRRRAAGSGARSGRAGTRRRCWACPPSGRPWSRSS
jgi:predicted tellurium resistance membrane protein TerC